MTRTATGWGASSPTTARIHESATQNGNSVKQHLLFIIAIVLVGLMGCSPSAERQIPGTWQGVNGDPMTLTFGPGNSFSLRIPAGRTLPFPMESSGSYSITDGGQVRILEGGEYYIGELRDKELVMVRPWGGGVSTRFRKVE